MYSNLSFLQYHSFFFWGDLPDCFPLRPFPGEWIPHSAELPPNARAGQDFKKFLLENDTILTKTLGLLGRLGHGPQW